MIHAFMKQFIAFCLFIVSSVYGYSQRFSVQDSIVPLVNYTSGFTAHWYNLITNHTNDTLNMRWIHSVQIEGLGRKPDWHIFFDDSQNEYSGIKENDSADFVLMPNATTDSTYYQAIGVEHFGKSGAARYYFTQYEIENPDYKVSYYFDVKILNTSIGKELSKPNVMLVYPNPVKGWVYFSEFVEKEIRVFDTQGKLLLIDSHKIALNLGNLNPGSYVIKIEDYLPIQVLKR